MQHHVLRPIQALNKTFLQVNSSPAEIEKFKLALTGLLENITLHETQAQAKSRLREFLQEAFYAKYGISAKGNSNLMIHVGSTTRTRVGVLLEVNQPDNKAVDSIAKHLSFMAFYQLLLSYLRERLEHNNHYLRHLIVTSGYEWFVFEAMEFDRLFLRDTQLKRDFTDWSAGRKASGSVDFFCQKIAAPYIANLQESICYTYFNLRDFEKLLHNEHPEEDKELVALYQFLSPAHLLKQFSSEEGEEENSSPVCYAHIKGLRDGF